VQRELAIALRSRSTWLVLALGALLIGHSFVLAVDVYSASSRSALGSLLQTREMDPLAGVVRPTLGGLSLGLSLLGPIVAVRPLAIEKERRSYAALSLSEGSTSRVLARKAAAGACAVSLFLVPSLALFFVFCAFGGHLDAIETAVALLGETLHVGVIVAIGVCAAAWTKTFAQAVTLGVATSLTSWAIDVADGFAALAWLGRASAWSLEHRLDPFQRGTVALGSVVWLLTTVAGGLALALIGGAFAPARTKALHAALAVSLALVGLVLTGGVRKAYDWSEARRASLPPAAVEALRAIQSPIDLEVYLDRDDSRRTQLERDALAKLRLARSDISIRMPLDATASPSETERNASYGRIVVRVGGDVRETRSSSRREIVTLIFEAAGQSLPDWSQPAYSGYPIVFSGARRTLLGVLAYVGIPLSFALVGVALTQGRTAR
jgi:ABC-2 type transport system permease protein